MGPERIYRRLLGLLLFSTLSLSAVQVGLQEADEGLRLLTQGSDSAVLSLRIGALDLSSQELDGVKWLSMSARGAGISREIGRPALIEYRRIIEVPLHAENIRAQMLRSRSHTVSVGDIIDGVDVIVPAQQSLSKDASAFPEFKFEKDVYSSAEVYVPGGSAVKWTELGIMRDRRFIMLTVSPAGYRPVDAVLDLITNAEISVTWEIKGAGTGSGDSSPVFDRLAGIYAGTVETESEFVARSSYMIIAPAEYSSALEEFIRWKGRNGFDVEFISIESLGGSADQVRNMLISRYENPSGAAPFPDYLLLVGDREQVPTFNSRLGYSHITDLYYGAVIGNDTQPDILVGRFPAVDAGEAALMAAKTMRYASMTRENGSYLGRVLLIAGQDSYGNTEKYGIPTIDYARKNYFNSLNGYDQIMSLEGSSPGSAVLAELESGVGFLNYTGHGSDTTWLDPRVTNVNISSLSNDGMLPLVVSNGCRTGNFTKPACFGESWLRAPEGGSPAFIGSTNDTYWEEDVYWSCGVFNHAGDGITPYFDETGTGAYDIPFISGAPVTQGELMFSGNAAVEQSGSALSGYYWEVYTLFGDPSLANYWGGLHEFTGELPAAAAVGSDRIFLPMSLPESAEAWIGDRYGSRSTGFSRDAGGITVYLDSPVSDDDTLILSIRGQGIFPVVRELPAFRPGTFQLSLKQLQVLQEQTVTLSAADADGMPAAGLQVYFSEAARISDTLYTDSQGELTFSCRPLYGPELIILGKKPGDTEPAFRDTFSVEAPELPETLLNISTDIGLDSALPSGLPALLSFGLTDPLNIFYSDDIQEILSVNSTDISIVAGGYENAELTLMKEGYNIREYSVPVITALAKHDFLILDDSSSQPLSGARLLIKKDSLAVFSGVSGSDGRVGMDVPMRCGTYEFELSYYGYAALAGYLVLTYGDAEQEFRMGMALSTELSVNVEDISGSPLVSQIFLLDRGSGDLLFSAETGPDGTAALEIFPWSYTFVAAADGFKRCRDTLSVGEDSYSQRVVLSPADSILLIAPSVITKSEDGVKGRNQDIYVDETVWTSAFVTFMEVFEIPFRTVYLNNMGSVDPGNYQSVLLNMGISNQSVPAAVSDLLKEHLMFGGKLLAEGGELAYAMRYDEEFLTSILHVSKFYYDGSYGNYPVLSGLDATSVPNSLPDTLKHLYDSWEDQDLVVPDTSGSIAAAYWSKYPQYPAILIRDGNWVYLPFSLGSLIDEEEKFLLLSNLFHYLGTGSSPVLRRPLDYSPGDGYLWAFHDGDSLAFDWTLTGGNRISFLGDGRYLTLPADGHCSMVYSEILPLDRKFWWTVIGEDGADQIFSGLFELTMKRIYVGNELSDLPTVFSLSDGYPNPFNPAVRFEAQIPALSDVVMTVYDIRGARIDRIFADQVQPGSRFFTWNGSRHGTGIYFAEFRCYDPLTGKNIFTAVKKITLLK